MILSRRNSLFRSNTNTAIVDRRLSSLLRVLAIFSLLLLVLVVGFLVKEAWPVVSGGGWKAFIADASWYPLEAQFGILPMLWASLAMTVGAILLALPLGLGSAIFLRFYAPPFAATGYRLCLNVLAGIPSVVYGLWGLTVLVPLIAQWQAPGTSLLAAILVLTLMILPTVALTSAASLAAVPRELLAGAAALGISSKGQILAVAIPAARAGISSGVLLATARALGETMAVLMVAGNVVQTPASLFSSVRALTANIALEMAYATGQHRAGLFASGLLLTLLVLVVAWLAARAMANDQGKYADA